MVILDVSPDNPLLQYKISFIINMHYIMHIFSSFSSFICWTKSTAKLFPYFEQKIVRLS
jgi:hypothetical protein